MKFDVLWFESQANPLVPHRVKSRPPKVVSTNTRFARSSNVRKRQPRVVNFFRKPGSGAALLEPSTLAYSSAPRVSIARWFGKSENWWEGPEIKRQPDLFGDPPVGGDCQKILFQNNSPEFGHFSAEKR